MGVLCLLLVLLSSTLCPSCFNHLDGEDRAGGFTLVGSSLCSVSLPHGAMGWSTLFDCFIS